MGGNVSNLEGIRSRLEALMRHAGGTDYAAQVIADNIALVAEVEQLRAAAVTTLNNAWEDGAREERQNVTAHLRGVATSPPWNGEGKPLLSTEARLVLILQAAAIERGDHREGGNE
jgi:hypothetical protein